MRSVLVTVLLFMTIDMSAQINVYDCNGIDPTVTYGNIIGTDYEFHKQCIDFDAPPYTFDQDLTRKVIARNYIKASDGFHAGSFTNGHFHMKIDAPHTPLGVFVLNYNDLQNIQRYKKLELGIELQGELYERISKFIDPNFVSSYIESLNPFIDNSLDVNVKFTHKATGTVKWRDAFFYQDYSRNVTTKDWDYAPNPYPFRVRFAPPENGIWNVEISITWKGDNVTQMQTITLPIFTFNVIESGHPGYVKVHHNKRNLQRGADIIFPLGHAFPCPYNRADGSGKTAWGMPSSTNKNANLDDWIAYLGDIESYVQNGGKYIRTLQTSYSSLIEFENLGNYYNRMHYAWEQDKIMDLCEASDVMINFDLLMHDVIMGYGQNGSGALYGTGFIADPWDYGPYGPDQSINPEDYFPTYCYYVPDSLPSNMFLNPELMYYHKQRTRYYVARYGYSPQIYTWELMSEPLHMDEFNSNIVVGVDGNLIKDMPAQIGDNHTGYQNAINAVNTYHNKISNYIKNELHDQDHLITMDIAPIPKIDSLYLTCMGNPNIDVLGYNLYDSRPDKLVINKKKNKINNYDHGKKNLEVDMSANEASAYKSVSILNELMIQNTGIAKPIVLSEVGHNGIKECKGTTGNIIDVTSFGFSGIAGMHPWSGYGYGENNEYDERELWQSTITAEKHMNSEAVVSVLNNWDGYWKQGRQVQRVYQYQDGFIKELQYYLSQDNQFACGYVKNRSYNILTYQVYTLCDNLDDTTLSVHFKSPLDSDFPFAWNTGNKRLYVYGVEKNKVYKVTWYDITTGVQIGNPELQQSDNQYRIELHYPWLFPSALPIVWFSITQDLAQRVSDDAGSEKMDVEEELGISVYPNPFTDEIVISTEADDNVKIYTSQGRLVLEKALTRGESLIQMSSFSSGMYFIQFTNAGITLKMIKP